MRIILPLSLLVFGFSSRVYAEDCFAKCQTAEAGKSARAAADLDEKSCRENISNKEFCDSIRASMQKNHQLLITWPCFRACTAKTKKSGCSFQPEKTEAAHQKARLCVPIDFTQSKAQQKFSECFSDFEKSYGDFENACLDSVAIATSNSGGGSASIPPRTQDVVVLEKGDMNVDTVAEYRCPHKVNYSPSTKVRLPVYGYVSFVKFAYPVSVLGDVIDGIGGHWNWGGIEGVNDRDSWLPNFVVLEKNSSAQKEIYKVYGQDNVVTDGTEKLFKRNPDGTINTSWIGDLVVNLNALNQSTFKPAPHLDTDETTCTITPSKKRIDISVRGAGWFPEGTKNLQ